MLNPSHLAIAALLSVAACHSVDPITQDQTPPSIDDEVGASINIMQDQDLTHWNSLAGTYEVVAVRRASFTAAPLDLDAVEEDPRGKTLTFGEGALITDGLSCDAWTLVAVTGPDVMDDDPILDDLRLPRLGSEQVQSGRAYDLGCEGEHVFTLYQADPNALAIPWDNGASYLIAEKPLSAVQIHGFQKQLVDMKFQSGDPGTSWSGPGLIGLRSYYSYRTRSKDAYIFDRPAITASLVQDLGLGEID